MRHFYCRAAIVQWEDDFREEEKGLPRRLGCSVVNLRASTVLGTICECVKICLIWNCVSSTLPRVCLPRFPLSEAERVLSRYLSYTETQLSAEFCCSSVSRRTGEAPLAELFPSINAGVFSLRMRYRAAHVRVE